MGKSNKTSSSRFDSYRPYSPEEANGRATLLAPTSSLLFPREAQLLKTLSRELEEATLKEQRQLHLETIVRASSTHAMRLIGQCGAEHVYTRPLDPSRPPVFSKLDGDDLVSFVHDHAPTFITGDEASQISRTLMVELRKKRYKLSSEFLPRRIIAISSTLFWDSSTATLHEQIPPQPCYIHLFDSSSTEATHSSSKIPVFDSEQVDEAFSGPEFMDTYNSVLNHLEKLPDHIFPATPEEDTIPHSPLLFFIEDWANGYTGFYWDLLKVAATTFMSPKPEVALFLTGTGANGKSAYVNLLRTLLGTNNVAGVQVSKLGDWHRSSRLQYTLLNAPDDEDKDLTEYTSDFKSIVSHETYEIPIMRSQLTAHLNADFMCIFPMNHKPDWSRQDDAPALMRRTIDLPFTGVFDTPEYRTKYHDFYKECYTLPALRDLLAYALAIATFYTRHRLPIAWSPMVARATERLAEKNNSAKAYQKLFFKFFDGYQTMQLLYLDYILYCKMADVVPAERAQFEMLWAQYENMQSKDMPVVSVKLDNGTRTTARCRRLVDKPNYHELLSKLPLSTFGIKDSVNSSYYQAKDIASLHENEKSIVFILNALYEMKKGEENGSIHTKREDTDRQNELQL